MSAVMERPRIDMKAIELAAQSPDARVRSLAQRRLEIEKEIEPLDGFLSFYCAESVALPVSAKLAVGIARKPSQVANGAAQPKSVAKGKTERMIDAANVLIVAHGRPMQLAELYEAIRREHADLSLASPDSMRARLAEHRGRIARIDGRGYWPAGVEVPDDNARPDGQS